MSYKKLLIINFFILFSIFDLAGYQSVISQTIPKEELDLKPEIIENSPVLQNWLKKTPNVLEEIKNDPSFSTRIRFGYSQFPSTDNQSGFNIGIEDVFLGKKGLTFSADYETSFKGDRTSLGGNFAYYILPLGNNINIAPVLGYRYLESNNYSTDGVNLGVKLMFAFSRQGAGDISLTQTFISPGSSEEVGVTSLSLGYALTKKLRISTDIKKENSRAEKDSRVGIVLELLP
jgi:hypothetical protein